MNQLRLLLTVVAMVALVDEASGQRRLESLIGRDTGVTFADMMKASFDWTRTHGNEGDKWYQRWEAFNAQRVGGDGSLADARTYWSAARSAIAAKRSATAGGLHGSASGGWAPLGPSTLAVNDDPSWIDGIGRINCIAFHPTDSNTLWVGVAQGGVWKTVDGGASWMPLTDDLPILRISDIAVDPVDPDVIYISVGDFAYIGVDLAHANRKRHTHYGLGVYKTIDGGATWNPSGLSFELSEYDGSLIRRVLIHPDNRRHLLAVGTSGTWTSHDAGATWTHRLTQLIWDIERSPADPNVLYASTGRLATFNMGTAGIIKSTDFGATWLPLASMIPGNEAQRIEIAVSPTDPNYVYAVASSLTSTFHSFVRSTNAGATWTVRASAAQGPNILGGRNGSANDTRGQGTYDLAIIVDAKDRDRVFVGGINIWGTEDGGATWDGVTHWTPQYGRSIHADHHQFAYNPLNKRYYMCNDGGINTASEIIIGSWSDAERGTQSDWPTRWQNISSGLAITSFYRAGVSRDNFGYVIAGAQDNASFYFDGTQWKHVFGGDGMDCFIDHSDPEMIYASSQFGVLIGSTDGGSSASYLSFDILDEESGEWTTPFVMPPTGNVMYAGFGNVWRSNAGASPSWQRISNFADAPGLEYPTPISALSVSLANPNYIYVGKRIWHMLDIPTQAWMTPDGGATWRDISAGLPDSLYLTSIATHSSDANVAWATFGGFVDGVKVYKTTNAGATWTNISRNLSNLPANAIVHNAMGGVNDVYIGTDIGVYRTSDALSGWVPFSENLPNVIVSDLELHHASGTLYAATFGRGIWMTDLSQVGAVGDAATSLALVLQATAGRRAGAIVIDASTKATLSGARIDVIDVLGRIVASRVVDITAGSYREELDLGLRDGVYFVRVAHREAPTRVVRVVVRG